MELHTAPGSYHFKKLLNICERKLLSSVVVVTPSQMFWGLSGVRYMFWAQVAYAMTSTEVHSPWRKLDDVFMLIIIGLGD